MDGPVAFEENQGQTEDHCDDVAEMVTTPQTPAPDLEGTGCTP